MARNWAFKLERMSAEQRRLAEKFINEILFEGEEGNFRRHSVMINLSNQYSIPSSQSSVLYIQSLIYHTQSPVPQSPSTVQYIQSSTSHTQSTVPQCPSLVSYIQSFISHTKSTVPQSPSPIPYMQSSISHTLSTVPQTPSPVSYNQSPISHTQNQAQAHALSYTEQPALIHIPDSPTNETKAETAAKYLLTAAEYILNSMI
ncbi:unnamed protein product [Parnassius apollo]|uniref:(apollo) hypothetical protein n=1 Tax=Parnassius apollo TaxID=110799 RepID=A0A8S3WC23_PARAO|nr:unnamed protein product [Parnassius apollo]